MTAGAFIHTSDWQIGRTFGFLDDEAAGVLADARIAVIGRIAALARAQGVQTVLVAGDVYDIERPSERTLKRPIERMAAAPDVQWHLIAGNHDPHRSGGPWERLMRAGLPANVSAHVGERPVEIEVGMLLPASLRERHAGGDPTSCFETMATPEGLARIGLAHGSVRGFGRDQTAHNRIAADRALRCGLAYLALGDWHGAQEAGPRCWYSGTPETDDFSVGGNGGGEVLVVRLAAPGAPLVMPHRVGQFTWDRVSQSVFDRDGVDALEARLRAIRPRLDQALVWLEISGALTLSDLAWLEAKLDGVGAALRALRVDRDGLIVRADAADLDAIERAGPLRAAADRLAAAAAGGDDVAGAALVRLAHLAGVG